MSNLLQPIADVDCAEAFRRFESDEVTTLRRYHDVCVLLGESEFFNHGVRFSFKASPQESYERLDHAGATQLRSVVMDVRQLLMKKERTHFPALRNNLRRSAVEKRTPASSEAVTQLDGIGHRYKAALHTTLLRFVEAAKPLVPLGNFTAEHVITNWVYAGAAHWDEEKAAFVGRWSKPGYEFQLSKAIHALCDVYWELDILVQGILGEDSLMPASAAITT